MIWTWTSTKSSARLRMIEDVAQQRHGPLFAKTDQLLRDRVTRGGADHQRLLQDGERLVVAEVRDGPNGVPLHLRILVVEHRGEVRQRVLSAEHAKHVDGGPANAAGFDDCFSRSTVSRPAAPNPNSSSRSRRIARLFSSTMSASASGPMIRVPTVRQSRLNGSTSASSAVRRTCTTMWRARGPSASASIADSAAARTGSRPPSLVSFTSGERELLRLLMSPTLCPSFDLGDDRARATSRQGSSVALDVQQIEQQIEVELPHAPSSSTVASQPCDSLGGIVGDPLDLNRLCLRARQLPCVFGETRTFRRSTRPACRAARCHSSSKPASCPSGLCRGFLFREIEQPLLPIDLRHEQLQRQRQPL